MRFIIGIIRVLLSVFALAGGLLFLGLLIFSIAMVVVQKPHAPDRQTDAIIVLTGGSGRVEEGLRLYQEGLSDRLLVSGVHKDVRASELLQLWKGPAIDIAGLALDPRATTTLENAVYSQEWIEENGIGSIRLITAYYHMPRAYWEFKRHMPGLTIIPHAVQPETGPPYVKMLFGEYAKTILTLLPTTPES